MDNDKPIINIMVDEGQACDPEEIREAFRKVMAAGRKPGVLEPDRRRFRRQYRTLEEFAAAFERGEA